MSRSGYGDYDGDGMPAGLWEGAVHRAITGKRGQQFFRELADAMDAMPKKELIANELEASGAFCTLGVLGAARGVDMSRLDPDDYEQVARVFGIADSLAREVVYQNDEVIRPYYWMDVEIVGPMPQFDEHGGYNYLGQEHVRSRRIEKPADVLRVRRWKRMRKWVADNLRAPAKEGT